jgi:hypothetical protein
MLRNFQAVLQEIEQTEHLSVHLDSLNLSQNNRIFAKKTDKKGIQAKLLRFVCFKRSTARVFLFKFQISSDLILQQWALSRPWENWSKPAQGYFCRTE